VGVMLGGAIDAAACGPEMHPTNIAEVHAVDPDQDSSDRQGSDDDACVHGHCHHGTQTLVRAHDVATVMFVALVPPSSEQAGLLPFEAVTPKRPPRA